MSDAPIFIVACPRSGTGLLRDLLRSHPRLAFPPESHFIPSFYRAFGNPRDEGEARRVATEILRSPWVRAWGLPLEPDSLSHLRSFREIVSRLYEEWARLENKVRWGDKTPPYVREIPTLLEIFPNAQILHIIRDGRDVALSWRRTAFGPRNLFAAANSWKRYVSCGRRTGATLPHDTYMEVRYESIVSDPEETLRAICGFLGEPFVEAVLRPNPIELARLPRLFGDPKGISKTEIIATSLEKWRRKMSASDRSLFESVAGDLLQDLGYVTEGNGRSLSGAEKFMWTAHEYFGRTLIELRNKNRWAFLKMRWMRLRGRLRFSRRRDR